MSFLDDLIKTIQEAVDEANGRPPRPVETTRPAPPVTGDERAVNERLRRRYEEARRLQSESEMAQRTIVEAQHRQVADATAAASAPAVVTAHAHHPQAASSAARLGQILRHSGSAREAFLVSEVFGRPVSQRHLRR